MADTRQVVNWALERKCSMRTGEEWFRPVTTQRQLWALDGLTAARQEGCLFEGVCITSYMLFFDAMKSRTGDLLGGIQVPFGGFVVQEELSAFGGLEVVEHTCRECVANAEGNAETELAQCHGALDTNPDSLEVEWSISRAIANLGLEDAVLSEFRPTTPTWYGLWVATPLRGRQCELLTAVFEEAFNEDKNRDGIEHFVRALRRAVQWHLPLHVSMAPPGHTDLGYYTVFPHCPVCKAAADVGRWLDNYPSVQHTCKVCGNIFDPSTTHRSEQYEWPDEPGLVERIGRRDYERIVRDYLAARGHGDQQIEEVIDWATREAERK